MRTTEGNSSLIPGLPDEEEYPSELTECYELLECLSEQEDSRTLLARNRESGDCCIVKCYMQGNVLFERSEPMALRSLDAAPMPCFLAEYRNDLMRCVLREYIPGETLAEIAKRREFSEEDVIGIGLQLCEQLQILHSQLPSIIHRDIKPQNVVILQDNTAVLIDFGIAREHTENETDTVAFGTQGFAPPEQYGFSQTDARSDIYSLGILLYWLLHRETKVAPGNHTALEKVIARCTQFDPGKRFTDVRQMERALQNARPSSQRKRKGLLALAACLILAVLVFGISIAVRFHPKEAVFSQPLVEKAVRANLGLSDSTVITEDMLAQVTGIYIVADAAYPDADSFYPAISQWYAEGLPTRGPITDLSDLARMPGLEQVCIVAQELSDISALSRLPKLNKVEFKHNYLTDISALTGMIHLTSVGINDNPVQDISPLAQCPNLAFLDLCDVRSYDPSAISQLGNLDFLDISNPTESYRYLDGKSILDLRIAWTGLNDLHVLDHVTRLERLEIDHTDITDLSPLKKHTGLRVLKIAGLPVNDLQVLLELPQLEEVYVSEEQKPAVEALGGVPFRVFTE